MAGESWGRLEEQRRAGLWAPRSPIRTRNTRREILRILAEQPGLSGAEIYERIPSDRRANRNKVYERLRQLRTKGDVERDDEGGYRLPEAGSG